MQEEAQNWKVRIKQNLSLVGGGNGNAIDNSYCLYAGLDCSATWCIQQSCADSITDWQFGYHADGLQLIWVLVALVGIASIVPVIIKSCLCLNKWKVCKRTVINKSNNQQEIVNYSIWEIIGIYFCCFLWWCHRRPLKNKHEKAANSNSKGIRLQSKYMDDIESEPILISDDITGSEKLKTWNRDFQI